MFSEMYLYEDEDIIVANKISGLLTVPGKKTIDSLTTRIKEICPNANPIHRLDMSTSGIVLFAKNKLSCARLTTQFMNNHPQKIYVAWVEGVIKNQYGSLAFPMIKDVQRSAILEAPVQKVDYCNGKKALTNFKVIARDLDRKRTLLMLEPCTGRTHQLRLHLKSFGHSILGDEIYGLKASASSFIAENDLTQQSRLLLHATMLRFKHPSTQTIITVYSPPEFRTVDKLRLYLPK